MSHPHEAQFPQIREWIRKEAAAKSLEAIRDDVTGKYEALFAAAERAPLERLRMRAGEGEWSGLEALRHVVEWNWQVGEDVLHVCLTGERPGNAPPSFTGEREGLIARGRESLESVWAHVSAADPAGFLDETWEHPFFGQMNWREWFLFLGIHAIDHTGQIESASGATNG